MNIHKANHFNKLIGLEGTRVLILVKHIYIKKNGRKGTSAICLCLCITFVLLLVRLLLSGDPSLYFSSLL